MEDFWSDACAVLELPLVKSLLGAAIILAVTAIVARIVTHALRRALQRDSNPLPNASIIVNIARGIVWLLGASIMFSSCFGIDVSSIIAALGVGGIAVSLGFQDTLANLIGGLQVTFMGIVKPGDNIEVGAAKGVVQDVSWRHTTIRDGLGQTVIIPNSIISKTSLVHLLPPTRVTVPFVINPSALSAYRACSVGDMGPAPNGAHPAPGSSGDASIPGSLRAPVETPVRPEAAADDAQRAIAPACFAEDRSAAAIDRLAADLQQRVQTATEAICPLDGEVRVSFSEIAERGAKGAVTLAVTDSTQTSAVRDAATRAIASVLE